MTARCLMMTITLTRMTKDYEEVGAESADADAEGGHEGDEY